MNVLHVFNEYLPKTEVWAYQLIRHCPDIKHFVIADYYANLDLYEKDVILLNRKKGLLRKKRANHSQYDFPRNLFKPLLVLGDALSSSDTIGALITAHQIDIVHVHFGTTAIERWDDLKDLETKLVISFYGWDYAKAIHYNPSYKTLYQEIFQKATLLITEGNAGRERLIELGAGKTKIKTLPLGVNLNSRARQRDFKQNDSLRLVQVASLSEKKGQLHTIQAFQNAIKASTSSMHLCLVGDDRDIYYAKEVKQYIKDQKLSPLITLIEWIDFNRLDAFLDDFDVFIHPSQHATDGDCEGGAPVILLHAQACGLPIISTSHCDIPEQVIHNSTGLLVEEGHIEGLTDAILEFATMSSDRYAYMSNQARLHIKNSFAITKIGNQLQTYYVDLIDGRPLV